MTEIQKKYIATSFWLLALAVIIGAFGAHGLKSRLSEHYFSVFETANKYHFLHAIGIALAVYVLSSNASQIAVRNVTILFLLGLIFFSGSLYLVSIADFIGMHQLKMLGAVAPVGGLSFIAAWAMSAYYILRS